MGSGSRSTRARVRARAQHRVRLRGTVGCLPGAALAKRLEPLHGSLREARRAFTD
jgi:hypothetical protein